MAAEPLAVDQQDAFGQQSLVEWHRLPLEDLLSDSALIDLLDRCPGHLMHGLSTGEDPSRVDEKRAALHTGLKGAG
jgi:hypothetical protein